MKSNMVISVEFLAGTDVRYAIEEAKQKANLFNVAYVCFDFNGTKFSIGKDADVVEAMNEYSHRDIGKPRSIVYS